MSKPTLQSLTFLQERGVKFYIDAPRECGFQTFRFAEQRRVEPLGIDFAQPIVGSKRR